MTGFEKIVELDPAFDKRHVDPKKNYGIGSVRLRMILKGNHGAVSFTLSTGWLLPHVQEEYKGRASWPVPFDLGYHSPTPQYEGQQPIKNCPYVKGSMCYGDGSTLMAKEIFETMLREGSDGVWLALEKWYREWFSEEMKAV